MSPRGRPRGFDRDEALKKAMEIFWRKGFDNTSMADLTEAMALNSPSLYAAFGSKEALFREVVDLYTCTEGSGIWDHVDTAETARDAVAALLRTTAEAYTTGASPRGCMIVLSAPQMEGGNEAVGEELKKRRLENCTLLQHRLERAVTEGELPPQTNCQAIAAYFVCLQHGMSIQARDGASRETLLAIAEAAMAGWDALISSSRLD